MTRHSSRPLRSLPVLLVTFALLLASTLAASAGPIIPNRSTGGGAGSAGNGTEIVDSSGDIVTAATASFEDILVTRHDALAAAELEAATHRNTRSTARAEDVLQSDGGYAGEDRYAEAREAIIRHSRNLATV